MHPTRNDGRGCQTLALRARGQAWLFGNIGMFADIPHQRTTQFSGILHMVANSTSSSPKYAKTTMRKKKAKHGVQIHDKMQAKSSTKCSKKRFTAKGK